MTCKIHGIPVKLLQKTPIGEDPFGHPITEDREIVVDNVLVSPATSEDVINELNLSGKRAVYKLGIPKGDNNVWENQTVEFFNQKWRTIGVALEGIEDLIPLDWNKQIMVERYE